MKDFSTKLEAWNHNTFGHIFRRKKRNSLRLKGVQCSLARKVTESLLKLEAKLKIELVEILLQEELLWQRKYRINWLNSGDSNPKFFRASTLVRRHRNNITTLQNNSWILVEGKEALKDMALNFYSDLFKSDEEANGSFPIGGFPNISEGLLEGLLQPYFSTETKKAFYNMGSLKAPGPDGFNPWFL